MAKRINGGGYWLKGIHSTTTQELINEELEQVKSRDSDKDGKLKIARKETVKNILGRSPDYKDVTMMREFFELKPKRAGITFG